MEILTTILIVIGLILFIIIVLFGLGVWLSWEFGNWLFNLGNQSVNQLVNLGKKLVNQPANLGNPPVNQPLDLGNQSISSPDPSFGLFVIYILIGLAIVQIGRLIFQIGLFIFLPVKLARNLIEVQGMLFSQTALIGKRHRRLAAQALIENGSPEAVGLLADAIAKLDNELNQPIILQALEKLSEQNCIDAVCKVWETTRHDDLTALLIKGDWVADSPANVRVLSALKVGKLEVVTEGGAEEAKTLLEEAFNDADRDVAQRAKQCVCNLKNPDGIDYVCEQWVKNRDADLEQVIVQGNYLAQQPINVRIFSALKTGNRSKVANEGAEMIAPLLEASEDTDSQIATEAIALLGELKNQQAIDAFCKEWAITRSERLTEALLRGQYVAASPVEVRVLTALKTGNWQKIANDGAEIVAPLIQACEDADNLIATEANALLGELGNQKAIDVLCQEWAKTRAVWLTQALQQCGYIADSPTEVRVLTALKNKKREIITYNQVKTISPLLQACDDADSQIAAEATAILGELRNQQAIDVLCQKWERTRSKHLTEALLQGRYIASIPAKVRVLTALKTGQRQILCSEEANIINLLLQACLDRDSQIATEANKLLGELQNQQAIDVLCQEWEKTRSKHLTTALLQGRYIASSPAKVRVLTALKNEKLEAITKDGVEVVELLLQASKDNDPDISDRSILALQQLKNSEAQEFLCRLAIEQDHQIARHVTVAAQYIPRDPNQRALFYFLTEQWEKYEGLDFEHTMLETAYKLGDEQLHKRITEKARQAGRIELARILLGGVQGQRLEEMTDTEWETTIAVLGNGKHWEEMWRLVGKVSAVKTKQLLQQLEAVKWFPSLEDEKTLFIKLVELAHNCVAEIPTLEESLNNNNNLFFLCHLLVGQMSREDISWVQTRFSISSNSSRSLRLADLGVNLRNTENFEEIYDDDLNWLKFLQALINLRRRFDIEVEDAPKQIDIEEFDIEIE